MKKEWKKPTIEVVPLEFDKVMGTGCFATSGHTTPQNAACAVPGKSKCWT